MFPLICKTQNYAWGKEGSSSFVTRYVKKEDVKENLPYAELWMGTHPNGESFVMVSPNETVPLTKFIEDRKLGAFPFLYKILSIAKPLSIQLHPNNEVAEELFEKEKNLNIRHYKDPNHKPECAIALTKFEAMCGFRPYSEITKNFEDCPELSLLLKYKEDDDFLKLENQGDLKRIFSKLITSEPEMIKKCIIDANERIKKNLEKSKPELLFMKLYESYPIDQCCFCPWIFNYYILEPGESLYIKPNIPHSYVSGDIIECMANSDNVIRCGLTPKFIDRENLLRITDFKENDKKSNILIPEIGQSGMKVFKNDEFKEFKVLHLGIEKEEKIVKFGNLSVCLITSGEGKINFKDVKVGEVFLVLKDEEMKIETSDKLSIFFATVNE